MQETPPTEGRDAVRRKLAVYRMGPSTPFGRVLAYVLGILLLITTLFVSLVIFSVLLTAVLFLIVYVWWVSRRVRAENKDPVE
jgi:hypothetical protein